MLKKSTLIVQCPRCNVNVIVPAVKVFQCGKCGQYMTIEKQPSAKGDAPKPSEETANLTGQPPEKSGSLEQNQSGSGAPTQDSDTAK